MKKLKFEFKAIIALLCASLAMGVYYNNNGIFLSFGILYSIVIYLVFFFVRRKYKYLDTKDIEVKRQIIRLMIKAIATIILSFSLSYYTYNFFKEIYMFVNPQFGDPGLFLGFRELGLIFFGFLMAYSFYTSLFSFMFTDSKQWRFFLIIMLPALIFIIASLAWDLFLWCIVLSVIAWLLAQGGLIIYKKAKK